MLLNNPKAVHIFGLLADLDHWVGRLTPRSYGSDEMLLCLVVRIPRHVGGECRATAEQKARNPTHEGLICPSFGAGAGEGD